MNDRSLLQYNLPDLQDTKNAIGKPRKDVCQILKSNGFEDLYDASTSSKIARNIRKLFAISRLKEGQTLLAQYPGIHKVWYRYLSMFKSAKKIALVHDIESLRYWKINMSEGGCISDEIAALSTFDCLISLNKRMTAFLQESGLKKPIVELGIWDYLIDESLAVSGERGKKDIAFAGNLDKAPFILRLAQVKGVRFLLYGERAEGLDGALEPACVEWRGAFSSEEIPARICGGWGLVWDGDSIDTCSGVFGEYLRYNTPHKTSLYIVAERPVIVWREAAIAGYILKKGLGIAVGSLHELPARVAEVSDEAYLRMQENVRAEKKRLTAGKNLEEAVKKALAVLQKS